LDHDTLAGGEFSPITDEPGTLGAPVVHHRRNTSTLILAGTTLRYDKARSSKESRKTEVLADPRSARVTRRRSIAESSGFASMADLLCLSIGTSRSVL
jgi:hypothetical protein